MIMGPKALFNVLIKLIGVITIAYILMDLMNILSGLGYSGLYSAKSLYLIIMFVFGLYLLQNDNWFFVIGTKTTNLSFATEYTIQNIVLLCLKLIGIVLMTIQFSSLLDFIQFYISTDSVELSSSIWLMTINIVLLLLGCALLILNPIKIDNEDK
ncbi:MAG TPA: hypothetical protein DER60_08150 [Syntrophomonas sp.]|mgnify:CR=1 FL=1|nr:hypothetical protein [Syntrophomonas sp.]